MDENKKEDKEEIINKTEFITPYMKDNARRKMHSKRMLSKWKEENLESDKENISIEELDTEMNKNWSIWRNKRNISRN